MLFDSFSHRDDTLRQMTSQHSTYQTIRETILSSYPSHDFLGEEDVPPGAEASAAAIDEKLKNNESGFLWIVDPIDGTVSGISCSRQ